MNKDVIGLITHRLFSFKHANILNEIKEYVTKTPKYSYWAELLGFDRNNRYWKRRILHPVMPRDLLVAQDVYFTWLTSSVIFSRKRCAFSIINGAVYVVIQNNNQTLYKLHLFCDDCMCWNYLFENILIGK